MQNSSLWMNRPLPDLEGDGNILQNYPETERKKVTIIFISHRLTEVFDLCERVTVFCDGRFVTTKETGEVTKKQLISYMVGRGTGGRLSGRKRKTGNVVLEARHITGKTCA